jgi:hypothetical protein
VHLSKGGHLLAHGLGHLLRAAGHGTVGPRREGGSLGAFECPALLEFHVKISNVLLNYLRVLTFGSCPGIMLNVIRRLSVLWDNCALFQHPRCIYMCNMLLVVCGLWAGKILHSQLFSLVS